MNLATGPRPWTVWVFCLVSSAGAIYRSVLFFSNIGGVQPMFETLAPWLEWNRDWVIIVTSAWLTIDLIPVTAVWFFASRFARWFVLCMAILHFGLAIYDGPLQSADEISLIIMMIGLSVPIVLATLLFLPQSQGWFGKRGKDETAVFE